jgi:hypothetical protein
MRTLGIDPTLDERDDDRGSTDRPQAEPIRPRRLLRGVAAFLLGLTLGITGIVMVQSAFERHLDLFGPSDSPPPLRR